MVVFIIIGFLMLVFIALIGYLMSKIIMNVFKIENTDNQILFKILWTVLVLISDVILIFNAL
jgi:hypothetical protein